MKIENGVLIEVRREDIVDGVLIVPKGVTEISSGALSNNGYVSSFLKTIHRVELPEGLMSLGDGVFENCINLEKINIPKSLKSIGESAFSVTSIEKIDLSSVENIGEKAFENCKFLKSVKLNNNLTELNNHVFSFCSNLQYINLPRNLKIIGKGTFSYCQKLEYISFPKYLEKIDNSAFNNCSNLYTTDLPKSLKYIGAGAFQYCSKIKKMHIHKNVEYLGESSFFACEALHKVIIDANIQQIGAETFSNCPSLNKITLPNTIKTIGSCAFWGCIKLTKIVLPATVEKIDDEAFKTCVILTNINLHNNITEIGSGAFAGTNLKEIILPNKIKEIKPSTFELCKIEKILLPEGLTKIHKKAFALCKNLTSINFPSSLESIGSSAFSKTKLTIVKLGENVKDISDAFQNCCCLLELYLPGVEKISQNAFKDSTNLQKVFMPKAKVVEEDRFFLYSQLEEIILPFDCDTQMTTHLKYIAKEDDCFHLSKKPFAGSIDVGKLKGLRIDVLSILWNKPSNIEECKNSNVRTLYNFLKANMFEFEFQEFVENKNLKIFKQFNLIKGNSNEKFNINAFYKLYYNLGGFMLPTTENRVTKSGNVVESTIDYSQKVGEFLKEAIKKGHINIDFMYPMFKDMNLDGFKKDFTDFFVDKNNFSQLISEENMHYGFIAKCYNEFEKFQSFNTSHRGSQRQLKPTVEKLKEYFYRSSFQNITPETSHIAETLYGHFNHQKDFDIAVKIDLERQMLKTKNNILSTTLKENDVFEEIERLRNEIDTINADTLDVLSQLANKNYTFEWLERSDPTNFVLGKLCSCCSHLEGVGYGIMRASIVDPDVQNMVIRDRTGRIIAKSTLYINRHKGYGVFNNVELNSNVPSEEKQNIYNKYITAVKIFVQKYNQENPKNPIRQINVGMEHNDLEFQIRRDAIKSPRILKVIDYSDYGVIGQMHKGDSQKEQCILWEEDENEG